MLANGLSQNAEGTEAAACCPATPPVKFSFGNLADTGQRRTLFGMLFPADCFYVFREHGRFIEFCFVQSIPVLGTRITLTLLGDPTSLAQLI
jgi:hypothetical protein